jgi:hypothetical protein
MPRKIEAIVYRPATEEEISKSPTDGFVTESNGLMWKITKKNLKQPMIQIFWFAGPEPVTLTDCIDATELGNRVLTFMFTKQ